LLTNFNNNGNSSVFIGGGQFGVNYQIGNFVIGGEWDSYLDTRLIWVNADGWVGVF
jgi:hypothetical protein